MTELLLIQVQIGVGSDRQALSYRTEGSDQPVAREWPRSLDVRPRAQALAPRTRALSFSTSISASVKRVLTVPTSCSGHVVMSKRLTSVKYLDLACSKPSWSSPFWWLCDFKLFSCLEGFYICMSSLGR